MSRIGNEIIEIPEGVTVTQDDGFISVSGPKGELTRSFKDVIEITIADNQITLRPKYNDVRTRSLWGTYGSHLQNMIRGVTEGFEKRLVIEGVGYRAEVSGASLVVHAGYSHPVDLVIPDGLSASVEKEVISVSGIDKEAVGQFAANIRAVRKPEPYKGKGIRYDDEVIRRKEGKKAV